MKYTQRISKKGTATVTEWLVVGVTEREVMNNIQSYKKINFEIPPEGISDMK